MQVVLYSIAASGNASSGAEDNALQVFVLIAAGIQSLLFFLAKGYELFSEQREHLVAVVDPRHSTTGSAGAELPAVGVGRRTRVDPEGLDWSNWAQTVSSEEEARPAVARPPG